MFPKQRQLAIFPALLTKRATLIPYRPCHYRGLLKRGLQRWALADRVLPAKRRAREEPL